MTLKALALLAAAIVACAAAVTCVVPALADEVAKAPDPSKQGTGTAERPSPPAELQKLEVWEGRWVGESHIFASEMGPESRSKSSHRYRAVLGGMHLEGDHDFVVAGMLMQGKSSWSWNPETKQYQVVWLGNMSPMVFVYSGQFQDEKTLVLSSAFPFKGKTVTETITYVVESPDRITMNVRNNMSGEMKPLAEETFTRAAPSEKEAKAR